MDNDYKWKKTVWIINLIKIYVSLLNYATRKIGLYFKVFYYYWKYEVYVQYLIKNEYSATSPFSGKL